MPLAGRCSLSQRTAEHPSPPRGVMPGAGHLAVRLAVAEAVASDAQAGPRSLPPGALRQRSPGFASLAPREQAVALVEAALDPATLRAMLRHVYLAYYQHPMVLAAVGEPPRPPFPEGSSLNRPTRNFLPRSSRGRGRSLAGERLVRNERRLAELPCSDTNVSSCGAPSTHRGHVTRLRGRADCQVSQ